MFEASGPKVHERCGFRASNLKHRVYESSNSHRVYGPSECRRFQPVICVPMSWAEEGALLPPAISSPRSELSSEALAMAPGSHLQGTEWMMICHPRLFSGMCHYFASVLVPKELLNSRVTGMAGE